MKRKIKLKIGYVLWMVVFLIVIEVFILFHYFNRSIDPKLNEVVNMNIDKMLNHIITEYSLKEDYETIKDILILNKNQDGEIINIDFDLPSLYNFSNHITDQLKEDLFDLEVGQTNIDYYDEYLSNGKDYFVLMVPYGMASNHIYFSNLGPKLPVKVKFIGSILTGVKTKVTAYGVNNSLIEVFTTINISTLVVTPVSSSKNNRDFEILVASKIVEGTVPAVYGGYIEKSSNLIQSGIE